jgi:hypothetical protein
MVRGAALVSIFAGCNALWGLDDLGFEGGAPPPGAGGNAGAGGMAGAAGAGADGDAGRGGATICDDDDDCVDGDPCTVNACADGACQETAVGVGEPGTSEAACEGTCQTDGACGLSIYSRPWPGHTRAFGRTPLSLEWTGVNAPPPRGILAADVNIDGTRLWVFTDAGEGTVHVRDAGGWSQAPTADVFDEVVGTDVNSATSYRSTAGAPDTLALTTRGPGNTKLAFYFLVASTGDVTPDPDNPYVIPDEADPDAAPQASVDCQWELAVQTAYLGSPSWVVFWRAYDGDVYSVDGGSFEWDALGPDIHSDLWGGSASGGPANGTTRAALHTEGKLALIAP